MDMFIGVDGNEANQRNLVGIGQFANSVVNGLERLDKENKYFIYLKDEPGQNLPKERPGWAYKVFGPGKLWTQIALPLKLFTQRQKLDLFFSPSHYAPRFSPFPTVISIMDLWHHRHPEQFDKKNAYQLINWEKYSVKNSSRIITISEFTKSEIIKFYAYPAERITVAYPGCNKLKIKNEKFKIKEIRKKYGLKDDYLLYLGTLQPKKNLEGLIEAFAMVVSDHQSPITLVVAGKKGWLFESIFEKVRQLKLKDKIIFTGFIEESEKAYLISGAKCFVLPSFYEGFGIPVAEAMALGVPVAVSDTSSLPEAGGKAAFYFDPEKPAEIAESLLKVLKLSSEELEKVAEEGRKQAAKFTWENCAQKVLEAFEKVGRERSF